MANSASPEGAPCACETPEATYRQFESTDLGDDPAEGRMVRVSLDRCRDCRRPWLRYQVEDPGVSRSGRWARGLVDEQVTDAIRPESARAHLDGLPWRIVGGSWFGGRARRQTAPMPWE